MRDRPLDWKVMPSRTTSCLIAEVEDCPGRGIGLYSVVKGDR